MTEARGEIPTKIDRYEIIDAIGYGAMGAVYKAFDPIIKRPVAVKTLRLDVPPQSPDYKAFLERFTTEARTAGRLSHPNIVTLYDVGHTAEQIPWLAMEFVDGQTAAHLLEGERLEAEVVVGLVSQIASAIDYAHSEGVVHRDIKPSNVIVFGGEKVKVTDFGIAKLMGADVTHSGLMMGTPSYMSPEQAMGEDLDGRTDIFSLGVVAFEMLSGQQPFPGNNVTSILYKLVHTDPVRPDDLEVLGLLPDKWHEVFSRVLAKDPTERFPTAAEFVHQLELCLGSWFGALEGETVIMKGPLSLDSRQEADETPIGPSEAASQDQTVTFGAPPTEEVDATVLFQKAPGLDEEATAMLTGVGGDLPAAEPDVSDETVFVAPSDDSEDTLYAETELDDTLKPGEGEPTLVGATDATLEAPPSVPTATIRRKGSRIPPKLWLAGSGIAVIFALVLVALFGRKTEPPRVAPVVVPPPPVVVESGSLSVDTEPDGASVLVNGEERGATPLSLDELTFGTYELVLKRSGFRDEALSTELTAEAPKATFDIALRPVPAAPKPAYFRIRSTPQGSRVQIDGRDAGVTPIDRHQVRAVGRRVLIELEGFLPWEDTVRARAGSTETIDAELTPRLPSQAVEAEPETETKPAPEAVVEGTLVKRGELGVVNPRCVGCPPVAYPEAARRARMQGVVELSYLIDENGEVRELQVEESAGPIFDSAVVDTVRQWRYEPATKNGVRVKMRWVQRFRFQQGR